MVMVPWKRVGLVLSLGCVGCFWTCESAEGQLIGNRNVGSAPGGIQQTTPGGRLGNRPSSFRTPPGAPGMNMGQPNPGNNQGGTARPGDNNPGGLARQDSRFVRGNRQKGDFVGSNRTELKGFVGASQAVGVGNAPVATSNLRLETGSPRTNRPLGPLGKSGMYYPKLDLTSMADDQGSEVLADPRRFERIQERVRERTNSSVVIVQEGGVVVLRGEISSRRDSELIETILGFEPGVDRVRNELVIRPSSGRQF